jgi:four helix bundle protein
MVATLKMGYAPEGAKRRYEAHFLSKLSDCDGLRLVAYGSESENSETDSSLDFALACGYINGEQHAHLTTSCAKIGRMLGKMMQKAETFLPVRHPTSDL